MKTTSRTLGQIRKMGLIEVEIDPVDTRLKRVCFTKKGVEVERALYQNLLRLAKNINEIIAYQR